MLENRAFCEENLKENHTHLIPTCYLSKLKKKCNTIKNKCIKQNIPYVFECLGEPYKVCMRNHNDKYEIEVQKVYVDAHFELNGWNVVGTMKSVDGIRQIHTDETSNFSEAELVSELDKAGFICQHCNKSVRRNSVVLLENVETHEHKVVGTSCLKLFTGGLDGTLLSEQHDVFSYLLACSIASRRMESNSYYEEYDLTDSGICGDVATSGTEVYDLYELLCAASYLVRTEGFTKSSYTDSTADCLRNCVRHLVNVCPNEDDENLAREIIAWGKTLENTNSYLFNVKQLCKCGVSPSSCFGIVASMVSAYQRDKEKKIKIESKSVHVGNVGERITFEATLTKTNKYSAYDQFRGTDVTMCIVLFEDDNGNVFKWNTSAFHNSDLVGKRVTVTGRIKAHTEWHDVKQTELNRCKIEAV